MMDYHLLPQFRPTRLQDLVLWYEPWSFRGRTWCNLAPCYSDKNHGTAYGGVGLSTWHPQFPSAPKFDGVDDYVEVSDNGSLHFTDAITIEAWVKLKEDFVEGDAPRMVVSLYEDKSNRIQLYFSFDSGYRGKVGFLIVDDGSIYRVYTHETFWPKDTWFHFVGSAGSNGMKLYVNGEADYEVVADTTSFSIAPNINTIGCRFYNQSYLQFLNSTIPLVRIYKAALTPAEVMHNYTHHPLYLLGRGINSYMFVKRGGIYVP